MLHRLLLSLTLAAAPLAAAGNWSVGTQPRNGVVVWIEAPAAPRVNGAGQQAGAMAGAQLGAQHGGAGGAIYGGAAGMMAGEIVERELAAERWRNRAWTVHVQLDSGPTQTFAYTAPPPWRRGERVRILGGRLTPMPGAHAGAGR